MRRPGLRGCTGAFLALGVALAVLAWPRSLSDHPASHGAEGLVSRATEPEKPRPPRQAKPKHEPRIEAGYRPVPVASIDRMLERRMPDAAPEDRLRIAEAILEEARHAAVDPFFVVALIAVESGFNHTAESHRGARGLMQLLPSTLESEIARSQIEGDLDDPVTNVRAGMRYYRRLLRAFGNHDVALMAYNAGPNRILKYLKEGAPIPSSIQAYARKVAAEFRRLRPPAGPGNAKAGKQAAAAEKGEAPAAAVERREPAVAANASSTLPATRAD